MWSETLPSGRVRFKERYRNPLTGRSGTVSTTADRLTNSTRKAAERILQAKIREKMHSAGVSMEYTLSDVYKAYCRYQRSTCKQSTWDRNERVNRRIVGLLGEDMAAGSLNAPYVERRLDTGTASSYNERLRRFKAMIRWAYTRDMVPDTGFLDKLKPHPDNARERISDKYMERGELARVLGAMKVEKWRLLTEFLALTGLRIGEAIALEGADVTDEEITVSKTYMVAACTVLDSAKTEASNRTVSVQDELLPVIRKIRELAESYVTFGFCKKSRLFFPAEDGGHLSYNAYRKYFEEITRREIGRKLSPHALRHTMTSLFAEADVPLEVISRRLGHSDSEITRRIYLHITQEQKKKDAEKVRNVRIL